MPVRILYCIDSIDRGGTETQLVGLVNRLDKERFLPHICTLQPSGTLLGEAGAPHVEIGGGRVVGPAGYRRVRRLAAWMREQRIELVQTFFQDATVLGVAAARLAGVPVRLISFRDLGFWRTPATEFLMRRSYPLATGFLANAQAVKDVVCRLDGLDPARVTVIPNGVPVGEYAYREHLETPLHVGVVGNLNRRVKRHDLFLKAAARVARDHPDITWHLVGDGDLRPEYEALAEELGIRDRCVFPGRIVDVRGYLDKLAVGVLCSDSEGFSNALLEYMLRGCAVVATAVGGNLEVVRDGDTGLLVPPGNEVALASAIRRLAEERTTRLKLAARARALVEERYDWSACVAAHQEYYVHALRRRGVKC
ncbi:glycosyltransferase [bacterium]|nr:glycosyltransferase [bacterium]